MVKITIKGNPFNIKGDMPEVNSKAVDFTFVKEVGHEPDYDKALTVVDELV